MKEKKNKIISIDAIKEFDRIQHPFMTKALNKLEIEGNFLTMIKAIHKKSTANNTLSGKRQKAHPASQPGTMPTFVTSSQHYIRSSSQSKQARKRNKRHSHLESMKQNYSYS